MDPITKALHETWKSIVTESSYSPPRAIIGGVLDPFDGLVPERGPDGKIHYVKKPNTTLGSRIGPGLMDLIEPKPKPSPTPGKTPYDDRGGDAPQLTKTLYNVRGGSEDNVPTPTPKPTSGYGRILPDNNTYFDDVRGKYPVYQDKKPQLNMPTRTRTPQPAAPATTGSGLLSIIPKTSKDVLAIIPKPSKNMFSSGLNLIRNMYEERDAEGQMAKGELMNLASKAQELANMMKDDTQLEAWVQSKITKAKDYISSVHDYMNGNPDKID